MTIPNFSRTLGALALGFIMLASDAVGAGFDQSHALFDAVLKRHVKNARVDYAGLQAHPEDLNRYLAQVAAVGKAEVQMWTQSEQIAFLSNAYNAYTLKLIIDHYPVKSIKDIGGWVKGPWDQPIVRLFGQTLTLNELEHKILRVQYNEPRIHFALVCAAKGCPPLRSEAYVADRLEAQLDDQVRRFLSQPQKNRIETREGVIYLSPLFKWYAADFKKKSGSVLAALKPYWPSNPPAGYHSLKISYTDYDWSLNQQSH